MDMDSSGDLVINWNAMNMVPSEQKPDYRVICCNVEAEDLDEHAFDV